MSEFSLHSVCSRVNLGEILYIQYIDVSSPVLPIGNRGSGVMSYCGWQLCTCLASVEGHRWLSLDLLFGFFIRLQALLTIHCKCMEKCDQSF